MQIGFRSRIWLLLAGIGFAILSCCRPGEAVDPVYELPVPDHFPAPPIPADDPLTTEKVELGKKLFFDPILSSDRTVSCASCHKPEKAFSDDLAVSPGVQGRMGFRNAMTLTNVVYNRSLLWDGALEHLEQQVLLPLDLDFEMDLPVGQAIERLKNHPEYPAMFEAAYGEAPSVNTMTRALAAFQRTLISANSKYDRFVASGFDPAVLTEQEYRGYQVFFAESGSNNHAECFHCHGGFNFTDPENRFRNNGLYLTYADSGRFNITGSQFDVGKFKAPTLRNIAYTAPYMHDGSLATLEEVLDHYQSHGQPNQNRDILIPVIELSEQDKEDIIAFLHTLSDSSFISNPAFRP